MYISNCVEFEFFNVDWWTVVCFAADVFNIQSLLFKMYIYTFYL